MIRVESFGDAIHADLDEWIYMLKHEAIKPEFKSKYIHQAGKKLDLMKMSPEERRRYERYLMNLASERGIIKTAKDEGREEGRKEGRKEGLEEGREKGLREQTIAIAKSMKAEGISPETIAKVSGLTLDEVENLSC